MTTVHHAEGANLSFPIGQSKVKQMQIVRRQALSYSTALTPLFTDPPYSLAVLSCHPHACNLCTTDSTVITLVTPLYDNGPFHIVVPISAFSPFLQPTQAQYGAGMISVGNMQIELATAESWDPQVPLLEISTVAAQSSLHENKLLKQSALCTGPPAQVLRAQAGIRALKQGVTTGDLDDVQNGVVALAGLGPGLTPAGDDFLVGMLAALHATADHDRRQTRRRQQLIRQITETAVPRTTHLSAAWLRHAGQGHFGQRWHELIGALNRLEPAAIVQARAHIIATGATSGADGLFGFMTALDWC